MTSENVRRLTFLAIAMLALMVALSVRDFFNASLAALMGRLP